MVLATFLCRLCILLQCLTVFFFIGVSEICVVHELFVDFLALREKRTIGSDCGIVFDCVG